MGGRGTKSHGQAEWERPWEGLGEGETETAQKTPPACLQIRSQVEPPGLWGALPKPHPPTADECWEV